MREKRVAEPCEGANDGVRGRVDRQERQGRNDVEGEAEFHGTTKTRSGGESCESLDGRGDFVVADAAVVGSEEGGGGGSDDGGFGVGSGEGVNRLEGLPDGENDDFERIVGERTSEAFGADEAGDRLQFGKDATFEMPAVGREIFRGQAGRPVAEDHDAAA